MQTWPKPYLLELFKRAVAEGCIELSPVTPDQARSLHMALIRVRRKRDRDHDRWILPEYHLVTTSYDAARAVLYCIYNQLPNGATLPSISSIPAFSKQAAMHLPSPAARVLEPVHATPIPPPEPDFDAAAFVQSLMADMDVKLGKTEPS